MTDFYHAKDKEEKFYKLWENPRYFNINGIRNIWREYLVSITIKKTYIKLFVKYNIFKIIKNKIEIFFINKSENYQNFVLLNEMSIKFIISELNLKNSKSKKKLEIGK